MNKLARVTLGLASVALLASCGAKEISKEDAVKIAEGYDQSIAYKGGVQTTKLTFSYGENTPDSVKVTFDAIAKLANGKEEIDAEDAEDYRITKESIEAVGAGAPTGQEVDAKVTYKADGKKLTITIEGTISMQNMSGKGTATTCGDENGYILSTTSDFSFKESNYDIRCVTSVTYEWTK